MNPDLSTRDADLAGLDAQTSIRVVDFARQGDVIVVPERMLPLAYEPTLAVTGAGVAVVRSDFGGHTHQLIADGEVWFSAEPGDAEMEDADGLDVGVIRVGERATAYLIHPEHAAIGLAPGRYTVRRQREGGRLVHD